MAKHLFVFLSIIALVSLPGFVGCSSTSSPEGPAATEVTDQIGRVVHITHVPQRIISLAPSNTEILYALGLEDRVIGVTSYDDYPPEVKEKPEVGGFFDPNLETIVAMDPDLILATAIHENEVIPQMEQHGLNVVALDPKSLDEVMEAITLVGKITDAEKEASGLVDDLQARISAITDKTRDLPESQRPRVFYITWHDPLITVGSGNFGDDLIEKAGGTNITHNLEGSPTVTLEEVVQANPQVIIAGIGMGTGEDLPLQFALDETRLKDTDARLNDRVKAVSIDLAGRPGPRIVDGLEQFARIIHPELFE
jgi:iron complex transport system substrate-binding protein